MTDGRVLLAGGGNAILEFASLAEARTWTRHYTRWLHEEAPGLEVVVAHRPYDGRSLAWGLEALAIDLARAKLERRPSVPQRGLGVTAPCSVTGLPATAFDRHDHVPISRQIESLRKNEVQRNATRRWDPYLPGELERAVDWTAGFPLELDLMGRSHGDTSLVGIVHVDGNGVGRTIKEWLDRCLEEKLDDDQVRSQYREWSDAIDQLGDQVIRSLILRVASCVVEEKDEHGRTRCFGRGTPHELGFPLGDWRDDKSRHTAGDTVFLPLRPVLLGGDDLTFVCDGRIALDLATFALEELAKVELPHLGRLTACAGVALVKAHAPFHRGHAFAEVLCRSTKEARHRENQRGHGDTGCWLDWHIGSTRPSDGVEDVRRRGYRQGDLTMRPYPLVRSDGREPSWVWLDSELLGPGNQSATADEGFRGALRWARSRNRVKKLASLVPDGADAVQRQMDAWNAIEAGIELPAGLAKGGFIGRATPLLDAIELLDLHLRLEPDPRVADGSAEVSARREAAP